MKTRRSDFEVIMEIIELCQYPGLPITRLTLKGNLSYKKLTSFLFGLIDDQLLRVEKRNISPSGHKRETDYFVSSNEGDQLVRDFKDIRERITTLESQGL